jgi:hypothetical protein
MLCTDSLVKSTPLYIYILCIYLIGIVGRFFQRAAIATAAAAPPTNHCGRPVIIWTPPVLTFVLLAELPVATEPLDVGLDAVETSPVFVAADGEVEVEGTLLLPPVAPGVGPAVISTFWKPICEAKFV